MLDLPRGEGFLFEDWFYRMHRLAAEDQANALFLVTWRLPPDTLQEHVDGAQSATLRCVFTGAGAICERYGINDPGIIDAFANFAHGVFVDRCRALAVLAEASAQAGMQ